jgi:hypothetical protein
MASWKQSSEIVRTVPRGSFAIFLGGVACLFAGVGLHGRRRKPRALQRLAIRSIRDHVCRQRDVLGVFISKRMIKSLVALAIAQLLANIFLNRAFPPVNKSLSVAAWRQGVLLHNVLGMVFIVGGYILFAAFIRTEGKRFFCGAYRDRAGFGDPAAPGASDFAQHGRIRILRQVTAEWRRRWRSARCVRTEQAVCA